MGLPAYRQQPPIQRIAYLGTPIDSPYVDPPIPSRKSHYAQNISINRKFSYSFSLQLQCVI